ncbi:MAG: alpha/beta hydrolase [Chitinophagaceae bacterium]|nr:MAG: alpha/beta hydrolase [Chitinophagaceae bacterium]
MTTKTLSFQNTSISYRVAGSGDPVLLIHGFAEDSRIWDELAASLADRYQLIIPDLPGSGKSALLEKQNVRLPDYADAMLAILDAENIERAAWVGHSMGGYISLAAAQQFPEKVTALLLFHSSAYADDDEKKETRRKAINLIKEKGSEAFLKTAIPGLFADTDKSKSAIENLQSLGRQFTPEALVQYYEAMIAREDTTEVLRSTDKPIGFIMGEHDKAVPFEHSLAQSHLPSMAHIYILRHSAHMGMLEETEKSLAFLTDFLAHIYV